VVYSAVYVVYILHIHTHDALYIVIHIEVCICSIYTTYMWYTVHPAGGQDALYIVIHIKVCVCGIYTPMQYI